MQRTAELEEQGMDDTDACNRSWETTHGPTQFREYLARSDGAQAPIDELRDRLKRREDLGLVCHVNTAEKRCHRRLCRNDEQ